MIASASRYCNLRDMTFQFSLLFNDVYIYSSGFLGIMTVRTCIFKLFEHRLNVLVLVSHLLLFLLAAHLGLNFVARRPFRHLLLPLLLKLSLAAFIEYDTLCVDHHVFILKAGLVSDTHVVELLFRLLEGLVQKFSM